MSDILDLFIGSFLPPYHFFDLIPISIVLLVLVLGFHIIRDLWNYFSIFRFFSANKTPVGIIEKYEKINGSSHTALLPMNSGSSTIFIPRANQYPETYFVYLRCHSNSNEYIAQYKIPYDDYKRRKKKGTTIEINKGWKAVGYEEL